MAGGREIWNLKNTVDDVAEEAIEKTVKKEAAEEMAESTAKKEMSDTTEDLSQKHINKDDAIIIKKSSETLMQKAELGNKLDYQFGRAGGGKHNIDRTKGLYSEMKKLGFEDTIENREYFQQYYNNVLNDPTNIVDIKLQSYIAKELPDQPVIYYKATYRESFLMGKYGGAQITTVWDNNRLLSIIIKSGEQTRFTP